MASSKGCSFRCTWCAKPIWGNQYVQRSAREVAAEMTHLKHSHAPDHVWFADDIFGFRVDWVVDFTQAAGYLPIEASVADFAFSACYKWLLGVTGVAVAYWNRTRQPGWGRPQRHPKWRRANRRLSSCRSR